MCGVHVNFKITKTPNILSQFLEKNNIYFVTNSNYKIENKWQ